MLTNFLKEHRGVTINVGILLTGAFASYKLGHVFANNADYIFGVGSWKTYNFMGNSGRSPIYPL